MKHFAKHILSNTLNKYNNNILIQLNCVDSRYSNQRLLDFKRYKILEISKTGNIDKSNIYNFQEPGADNNLTRLRDFIVFLISQGHNQINVHYEIHTNCAAFENQLIPKTTRIL
mgnify:CR=1 FL=1